MISKNNQNYYSKKEILNDLNTQLSVMRGLADRQARKEVGKLRQAIVKVTRGRRTLYPSNRLKDILQA
jgi:hypothetical protein